jgi:TolB-like protein
LIYQFDAYSLDTNRQELRHAGNLIAVEPQVFDILQYLIGHRERVVSKDDLIEAIWKGRIVSESTLTSRITEARHAIGDTGEQQRLIRTIQRKGIRFVANVVEAQPGQSTKSTGDRSPRLDNEEQNAGAVLTSSSHSQLLNVPEKPSIAVLPFTNLSGDPNQEYFADGMVEDITIALGRHPWLFVIGSGSAFTYKSAITDTRRVGTELGVRYVLRGSVRRDSSRVRITVELADASHGGHIWAERFDDTLDNIFELQDRIAAHVSTTIAPAIRSAEVRRIERTRTENLTAYDLYLRAARHQRDDLAQNEKSLKLLYRAIELDHSYASAYGLAGFCHFWQKVFGWIAPNDLRLQEGVRLARLAATYGENDSEALWMAAQTLAMLAGEIEQAVDLIERSTWLNPNSPSAWWTSCLVRAFAGQFDEAIEDAERARRLNPLDLLSGTHLTAAGVANFLAGRYEDANKVADQVLQKEPSFPPALRLKIAICGRLGRGSEGRTYVDRLLGINQAASVKEVANYYRAPLRLNPDRLNDFLDGLRQSGLPEG